MHQSVDMLAQPGGGDPSFLKCLFFFFPPPFFFVSLKLLGDPGGAVVQRVHVAVRE